MQENEIFSQGIRAQKISTKHQTLQQVATAETRWDPMGQSAKLCGQNVIVFNGVRLRLIDGWQIVKSNDGWPPKTMNFDKSDAKERIGWRRTLVGQNPLP